MWILLSISLLLSVPSIWERATTEWNNNVYEFIVPYEEIEQMATRTDTDKIEIMQQLREAGVQTISVEPTTLGDLSLKGDIVTFSPERIREIAFFSDERDLHIQKDSKGLYIYVINETKLTTQLPQFFEDKEIETIQIQGKETLYIPGEPKELLSKALGYPDDTIAEIIEEGFTFVPRITSLNESDVERTIDEVIALKEQSGGRIIPGGRYVFGIQSPAEVKKVGQQLLDNGYNLYQIEMFNQEGFNTLAYSMDMQVIRMHPIDLNQIAKEQDAVDRTVRAVKERNIRSLFLRFDKATPEESVAGMTSYLKKVQQQMPSQFQLGTVKPFETYSISLLHQLPALVALFLFVVLAVDGIMQRRFFTLVAGVGTAVAIVGYIVLQKAILLKALALLIAVVAPVYAVLFFTKQSQQKGVSALFKRYGLAALFASIGIVIIVALLNGNDYLVGINTFKGVKLVYLLPIVFVALYAIYGNYRKIAKQPILYIHAVLALVLLVLVAYYMSRTGNAGTATDLELTIRQYLEQWLYARPRTKEFLIGFPFFVLALYVYPRQQLIGKILLVPGVIGFLSMVNTFTHFHIPLYVSVIRSVLGLGIGLLVGLLFIFLVKQGMKLYSKYGQQRWQE